MRSEPIYYPLIRVAICLACGLLGLVAMAMVGMAVDGPSRALVDGIADRFGIPGLAIFIAGIVGGSSWWAYSGNRADKRRDERRRVAETGVLEHRPRPFGPDGQGRNVALLLAPLALFAAIVAGLWLTGTLPPLPRASGP